MAGIGNRVRTRERRAKLSQADLAKKVGLTQQGIAAIESAGRATHLRSSNLRARWIQPRNGSKGAAP